MRRHILFYTFLLFTLVFASCGKKAEAPSLSYDSKDEVASVDTSRAGEEGIVQGTLATEASVRTNTPKDRKFKKTVDTEFKVKNVLQATEGIEDLIFSKGGYVINSDLKNRQEEYKSVEISRDTILQIKQIVVENSMSFKVPTNQLDSLLRKLKPFILFLDKRVIVLEDVTSAQERNSSESQNLDNYTQRQEQKIDAKGNKLKDVTNAEDLLLERKLQADEARIRAKELNYDIQYSTLNIKIYQDAITYKDKVVNTESIEQKYRPNVIYRIGNAFISGWHILEEIFVFFVEIWSVLLLIGVLVFGYREFKKKKRKKE